MAQVVWSPQAADDLEAIYLFIARDSRRIAGFVVERIVTATERLEQFPMSGRVVPEYRRDDLREVIVGRYRVVYRVRGENVEIATVHAASRPLGSDAV